MFLPAPRVGQLVPLPSFGDAAQIVGATAGEDSPGSRGGGDLRVRRSRSTISPWRTPDWVEPLRHPLSRPSTSARSRPTGRAWRRCRRWASLPGSTTRAGARYRVRLQAEAMKLAFADARATCTTALPPHYLAQEYLRRAARRSTPAAPRAPRRPPRSGGHGHCVAVDEHHACSLIQSMTALSARSSWPRHRVRSRTAATASRSSRAPERPRPGERPYHTIIPGLLLRDAALLGRSA